VKDKVSYYVVLCCGGVVLIYSSFDFMFFY
jgi:hypothetical protein